MINENDNFYIDESTEELIAKYKEYWKDRSVRFYVFEIPGFGWYRIEYEAKPAFDVLLKIISNKEIKNVLKKYKKDIRKVLGKYNEYDILLGFSDKNEAQKCANYLNEKYVLKYWKEFGLTQQERDKLETDLVMLKLLED